MSNPTPATSPLWETLRSNLTATRRQVLLYAAVYLLWGFTMNSLGKLLRIAEFATWWQVITCYVLYLVPASLLVRRCSFFQQYLYGLLTLAPLELLGYALGTSRAYPGNVLDRVLGERNFTLAMVVFFGWLLPLGNGAVAGLERRIFVSPRTAGTAPHTPAPARPRRNPAPSRSA
ncbi:MAG TPA: hypothetical protein VFE33_35080 [Thermoanaerobaculia bacterium]|nr:hypothetical protein [Thermoanaerobaculia bacterium]